MVPACMSHAQYDFGMKPVAIRDLRNHGGTVIDRVLAGGSLMVTRDGRPVAELRPIAQSHTDAATVLARLRDPTASATSR